MATKTEIANRALSLVGQQVQIAALTDNSVSARLCNLHLVSAVREILRSGRWKSARVLATLTQDGTAPAFGFAYSYALPNDFLRMVKFNETDVYDVVPELYSIVGKKLHTDESAVYIVYIADLSNNDNNVNVNDELLTNLFVLNLAIKLCWPLQQNRTLRDSLWEQLQFEMRRAKSVDAQDERGPLENQNASSSWLAARSGGLA